MEYGTQDSKSSIENTTSVQVFVQTPKNQTPYGTHFSVHYLGAPRKTGEDFFGFLLSILRGFSFARYDLLQNNCNNFPDECCIFLSGKHIVQYILDSRAEAMKCAMGPMPRPIIDQIQGAVRDRNPRP